MLWFKHNWKWAGFVAVAILLFAIITTPYFSEKCENKYTEQPIAMPVELSGGTIYLERQVYVVSGSDTEYGCLPSMKTISHELIGGSMVNSIPEDYYPKQGRTKEPIAQGKTFSLQGIVSITKRGISTIDSGSGPISWLLLRDEDGVVYKLGAPLLGLEDKDAWISNTDKDGQKTYLKSYMFSEQ